MGRSRDDDKGRKGPGDYESWGEWRAATFGDVRDTWNPARKGGFAGYANKADWRRATFDRDADDRRRRKPPIDDDGND